MGVKNYTFSGIRIEAMQIIPPMSEDDSAGLSKWIGEHNVTVTIETSYDIGTAILVESEGRPFEYSFYMYPGDWLAYDGDIFFHITDDVFRKHYREITGRKITDQGDAVVYATGGVLNLDGLPPAKIVTGGKVHQPFIDAIRKAQDKAKADTEHKKAKDARRPRTTAERTAEWRAPLETLAMYYNDFTPQVKPTPNKKHTQDKEAKKSYDSIHSYLEIIKELADTELYDSPAIRGIVDQAKRELDHLHPNLKGPNA